jgi:hypothetical protein
MQEGKTSLAPNAQSDDRHAGDEYLQLTMKRYASPGGANATSRTEIRYCVKSPGSGALNGLLLAKNEEHGRTPSRPNSWTTSILVRGLTHMQIRNLIPLPWENKTERMFPSMEREITILRAYGRVSPDVSINPNYAHPFCCRTIEVPEE